MEQTKTIILLIEQKNQQSSTTNYFYRELNLNHNSYINFDAMNATLDVKRLLQEKNYELASKLVYTISEIQHTTLNQVIDIILNLSPDASSLIINHVPRRLSKSILEHQIINKNYIIFNMILNAQCIDLFVNTFPINNIVSKQYTENKVPILVTAFNSISEEIKETTCSPHNDSIQVKIFLDLLKKFNTIHNDLEDEIDNDTMIKYCNSYKGFNLGEAIANTLDHILGTLMRRREGCYDFIKLILEHVPSVVKDKNFCYCLRDAKLSGNKEIQKIFKDAGAVLPVIHRVKRKVNL
jgi:hypothetical protein